MHKLAILVAAALAAFGLRTAHAGYITTPDLSDIFGQASFGATPITINWLPGMTIQNAALTDIDTEDDYFGLFDVAPAPLGGPTVNAFFVDTIDYCGTISPTAVGCATVNYNILFVESAFVDIDPSVIAHELGHTLGLCHVGDDANLMEAHAGGGTLLSNDYTSNCSPPLGVPMPQIDQILASPLVQTDPLDGHRFVNVLPIAIVAEAAAAVPAPNGLAVLAGLALFTGIRRRP
jgi:MYXO-CTERM domain-containing protein